MVMRQPAGLGVFLQGVGGGHGQRTDRNRTGDEEEPFVHDNPKSERYSDQQRNPGAGSIACLFCLFMTASFFFFLDKNGSAGRAALCTNCDSLIQILSGAKAAQVSPYLSLPSFVSIPFSL